ncbi:hypothetical protein ACH5RR_038312 [Cinchona calisaya]|uniref:Uncharacterized protein n=1 Tax=Cinchona calisaya TaxID=153742 RepID=A0ABD2Y0P6_9GENT
MVDGSFFTKSLTESTCPDSILTQSRVTLFKVVVTGCCSQCSTPGTQTCYVIVTSPCGTHYSRYCYTKIMVARHLLQSTGFEPGSLAFCPHKEYAAQLVKGVLLVRTKGQGPRFESRRLQSVPGNHGLDITIP